MIHIDDDAYDEKWCEVILYDLGVYCNLDIAKFDWQWEEDKHHGFELETWPNGSLKKKVLCCGVSKYLFFTLGVVG